MLTIRVTSEITDDNAILHTVYRYGDKIGSVTVGERVTIEHDARLSDHAFTLLYQIATFLRADSS